VTPKAIRKSLALRQSYKAIFSTPSGQEVLDDLIKKYVMADPVVIDDPQATAVNLGMQRLTVQILKKVFGSTQDLRNAIERSYQTNNQESE